MKSKNFIPLDDEEAELHRAIEENLLSPRELTDEERDLYADAAQTTLKKNQRINIRLSEHDLIGVKSRAAELGLPYQSLISGLIHQFVEGSLVVSGQTKNGEGGAPKQAR
jgi:predicted DNA binding CopG/RHH family protein